jgi:hypothetical protein
MGCRLSPRIRRALRRATRVGLFLVLLALGYPLALCYPQPWFPHHAHLGRVALYSDQPLPAAITPILATVNRRLAASAIDDPTLTHQVFLCSDRRRFAFFTNVRYRVGGVNYWYLNRNSFLRPAHVEANRLIGPSGREVPGDRTLAYFITHEVTHGLTVARIGRRAFWRLPAWVTEGYADYVGKGRLDVPAALAELKASAPEMDPQRSGLYLRYHLLVAYLLDVRKVPVQELLEGRFDRGQVEREVARWAGSHHG